MRRFSVLSGFILIAVLPVKNYASPLCTAEIKKYIYVLGSLNYYKNYKPHLPVTEIFEKLSQDSYHATGCIISELAIVNEKELYLNDENYRFVHSFKVVQMVRALRYMTGLDMAVKITEQKFNQEYNDNSDNSYKIFGMGNVEPNHVPFFAARMSINAIYLAPEYIQVEIIKKWKRWYAKYGKTYNYKKNQSTNPVFYLY